MHVSNVLIIYLFLLTNYLFKRLNCTLAFYLDLFGEVKKYEIIIALNEE